MRTVRDDRGPQGQHCCGMVIGWVGVGKISTNRRPVPHQRIGNDLRGLEQDWISMLYQR